VSGHGTLIALIGLTVLLLIAGPVGTAAASETHQPTSTIALPGSAQPTGVAINNATGQVFVVGARVAIYQFNSDGTPHGAHPRLTGSPSGFEPLLVAVDNSGTASSGELYVSGTTEVGGESLVQQYSAAGAATPVQIRASALPPDGTPQAGGLPPVANKLFEVEQGVFKTTLDVESLSVDPSGNIYLLDTANQRIDEFTASGTFLAQIPLAAPGETAVIAVRADGNIYAGAKGLFEQTAVGECVNGCARIDPGGITAVSVDASGDVLALSTENVEGEQIAQVNEYSSTGSLLSSSGAEDLAPSSRGVAAEPAGQLFVSDAARSQVDVFGPTVILPDATTLAPSLVTDEGAQVSGEIGAAGGPSAACVFQYIDEVSFQASRFAGAQSVPCSPPGPFTGTAMHVVEASLAGLTGGTIYRARILTSNSNGTHSGATLKFLTLGPTISDTAATAVSVDAADLRGEVNPNGVESTYAFQVASKEAFEATGFATSVEVPVQPFDVGSGTSPVPVTQTVTGLVQGTAYVARLVASSTGGNETRGPAIQFSTFVEVSQSLPDGRAYEQSTPTSKNGGDALGFQYLEKAAPNGDGISYFISGGGSVGRGGQEFPTYSAQRGSAAWGSFGFLPGAEAGARAVMLGWSESLRRDYTLSWNSRADATLYAQNVETGTLTEIAGGMQAFGESGFGAQYAGESSDGSSVLFESTKALTPKAREGVQNLYSWDAATDTLSLVDILPSGSASLSGAFAGPYDWATVQPQIGGSEAEMYTQNLHVISADGSDVFFTTANVGQLYVRKAINTGAAQTSQVSASQKTNGSGSGGKDPNGTQKAAFMTATPSGSFAFFTSPEKLTNNATTGPSDQGNDLYRYEVASGNLIDIAPDAGDPGGAEVQGVLGTSADGSYVYFAANGVLAEGASLAECNSSPIAGWSPGGSCNLYVWHEGTIHYIARLEQGSGGQLPGLNWMPTNYVNGLREVNPAHVSTSGSTLVFEANSSPTSYDSEGDNEFYRYNNTSGLTCVSCNPTGGPPVGSASVQDIEPGFTKPTAPAPFTVRNVSADGNRVFFETPDKLVASDTNGDEGCPATATGGKRCQDVYEWEASGTGSCRSESQDGGCIFLISTGKSSGPSYFADAGENGDDVFFFTRQSLVGQDRDQLQDVYDARVGGGIAGQNPIATIPCEGEACRGAAVAAPAVLTPSSAGFVGPGNPKAKACPRGSVRKKGRCAKRKRRHRRKRHSGHHRTKHHGRKAQEGKRGAGERSYKPARQRRGALGER
jgi:hypothetical protein